MILFVVNTVGTSLAAAQAANQPLKLHIVVIAGEDAVNVIQQRTAVAPMVEVRDENNQPVAGAIVRFTVRGGRATLGGANTVNATTNAVGQATASQISATAPGTVRIDVLASSQGQSASATITQTNYANAAQAASGGKPSQGGHGKLITLSAAGAAAAGAAYVATTKRQEIQPEIFGLKATPTAGIASVTRFNISMDNSTWGPGRTTFTVAHGDGEVWSGPSLNTGEYPLHVYKTTGEFRIRLTITDESGLAASAETTVSTRDVTGSWVSSAGTLNLVQSGTTLGGTYVVASGAGSGTVSGTISQAAIALTVTPAGPPYSFSGIIFDIGTVSGDIVFQGSFNNGPFLPFRRQ